MEQLRPRVWMSEAVAHRCPGELREVHIRGPSAPSLPPFSGPPIVYQPGPHMLELVVENEGAALQVSDSLLLRR